MEITIVVPPHGDLFLPTGDHAAFSRRNLSHIVDKGLRIAALMKVLRRRPGRVVEVAPRT